MQEILQILDGGGLLAFAVIVYLQLKEVRKTVSETLNKMLEVQTKNSENTTLILERQKTIMARQDDMRGGLNKRLGANTIPPPQKASG